jgi:hypothetical protein
VIDTGDVVYAARLPGGPIIVLNGMAAFIWTLIGNGDGNGNVSTLADRIAEATGVEASTVRIEVDAFVDDLLRRGLLEWDST